MNSSQNYNPHTFKGISFHDVLPSFINKTDNPRSYLERCLETIAEREPAVKAFVTINKTGARTAADDSALRYKNGYALSPIDGMPIGIKDLLETKDMPTQMGCKAYAGNYPKNDNAAVWALREAGAIILGKTVTAELGGAQPGPTTNPFDPSRTPGGSSSGSAAAIASKMLPTAIGTQVGGSIIRPAGYCGNIALKPSQGAINRGERQATSMSTHGIHASCIEDMWLTAIEIGKRVGGDRGSLGLMGPDLPPAEICPTTLTVLETAGWAILDPQSKTAFEEILEQLKISGIQLLRRNDNELIEIFENSIHTASEVCESITSWENRWSQRNLVNLKGKLVSERTTNLLEKAEKMTPNNYRSAMIKREEARRCHAITGSLADACITLSCPGPAPLWSGDVKGEPLAQRPTGPSIFNTPGSMIGAPCISIPMLSVAGMPVGIQIIGNIHQDARITGIARWILNNITPVALP